MKTKETMSLEDALIDLYLNVKVRKQDDIDNMNTEAIKEEKENLKKLNPLRIIDYIRNSIDILIDVKVEEKLEMLNGEGQNSEDKMNEYEPLLKKLESDIRLHIKMEHQLKLHSETLQSRVEELEKENIDLFKRNKNLNDLANQLNQAKSFDSKDRKESEISQLKSEILNMKQIIKSYEDQSLKMAEIEKKMKNLISKHEKEIKNLEEKYQEKIKVFSKKLLKYEEITKTTNSFKTSKKEDEEEEKTNDKIIQYHTSNINEAAPPKQKTLRNSKSPVRTDRNKNGVSLKDRIEQYRKLIDKNLQEITQSNASSSKGANKSGLLEGSDHRTNSSQSLIAKEKFDTNVNKRNNSLIKNLEKAAKNILTNKEKLKSHNRNCSMEVKQSSVDNKILNKSPVSGSNKNIHAMKENLLNNRIKIPKPLHQRQTSISNPGSNIILNQGGNPCINQITIYATNNPNSSQMKPVDLNLRNILNKNSKTRNNSKTATSGSGHTRNPSKNNL